jgi:hypothetical protein
MTSFHKLPPIELLRSELNYDAASGAFTWKRGKQGRARNLSAGYSNHGYIRIHVGGKTYLAHRLAFYMVHGTEPAGEIDHIDGNTQNNAIANLREASRLQNARNRRSTAGFQHRAELKTNPFQARIKVDEKIKHLGMFSTAEAARRAYEAAANRYFGEFSPARRLGLRNGHCG